MRIYVSSTSRDLTNYRAMVVAQLQRLGHDVVSMHGYTADARTPVDKCLDDVRSADVYVGLFAFHYGDIPNGYEYSITELEFREAGKRGLPRLIFVIPEDVAWPVNFVDRGSASVPMERFRSDLMRQDGFTVALFKDQTDLLTQIPQAIQGLAPLHQTPTIGGRLDRHAYRTLIKPMTYEAEKSKHLPRFTGRQWVESRLDDWIANRRDSRVFCLIGGPGIGKTAIACHWCNTRQDVVAFHHCVFGHADKTDPKRILLSLAAHLADHLPAYAERLSEYQAADLKEIEKGDARTVFDLLMTKPLGGDLPPPDGVRLIVIDALDEATQGAENELARILGEVWAAMPDWLRLVVTCRPEMDVIGYLGSLRPFILDASSRENLQDIRDFLRRELDALQASDSVITQIVEKSEGMFLYASLVIEEVRAQRLSLDHIADFPEGLTGYFKGWFGRKFPSPERYHDELHKLVSVIIAQRAPLPDSVLCVALGLSAWEVQQRLMTLGVLFPKRVEMLGGERVTYVTMMHKSLLDWLTEIDPVSGDPRAGSFAADLALGNRLLADAGWTVYQSGGLEYNRYFNQTLPAHLVAAQQMDRLITLLLDPKLVLTMWSKERRDEWQRNISLVSRSRSLSSLADDWLAAQVSAARNSTFTATAAATLCGMFKEMGAFDEAIALAEGALRIFDNNNVADSPDMVGALLSIGDIHVKRDELAQATESFERALRIAQRAYAEGSPEMADVLYWLSVFYVKGKREYRKASEYLERCLNIRRHGSPPDLVGMANCINDRAVVLSDGGWAADYLGSYREALSLFETACPSGHPELVSVLCNIANELAKESKTEEVIDVLRRAVALADRILLPQHEYSVHARSTLAAHLVHRGRCDEALDIMRSHVADLERYPGPDHDETAIARVRLCDTLLAVVHVSEATKRVDPREELREQCRRIRQCPPGGVLGLLALADQSRSLAEPLLRDHLTETAKCACAAYAKRSRAKPFEIVSAQCFRDVLQFLLSEQPIGDQAPAIAEMWERMKPELRPHADCLATTRKLVVSLIAHTGRARLRHSDEVAEIESAFQLVSNIGAEGPETLDHLASLTVALHHRGHEEASEVLCQQLFEHTERVLGPQHDQTLSYLTNLAFLKLYRRNFEQAESLFREALQRYRDTKGIEQTGTLEAAASVIECLLLRGDLDGARTLSRHIIEELPPAEAFTSPRKSFARCLQTAGLRLKNELSYFEASKQAYQLSLDIDPSNTITHNNIALLMWVCLNDLEGAKQHFEQALRLTPDAVTFSNIAHLHAQSLKDPEKARVYFLKAVALSPNEGAIAGNYAAFLLQQEQLPEAWEQAKRAMRLCMANPDRIMLRALFCATAVLLVRGRDAAMPLGQMQTLFSRGVDYVPWILDATLEMLDQLVPDDAQLLRALAAAISDGTQYELLKANPRWRAIAAVPLDTPWPEYRS